ncbi:MAG: amidohydrolase [Anaerovoracaceae bacterium]|nr:amidohydrolase [Clostridiales bacterium]
MNEKKLALINGSIITANEKDEIKEAVLIKGNKIVTVGKNSEVEELIDFETEVIDLKGRTVVPGFIDTHYHPILNGLFGDTEDAAIIQTSYDNCPSIEDILSLVRKAAKKRGPGAWISMMGYDQNSILEKRHVTLEELTKAAPLNPVQCMRACGHISVYNKLALEEIGVYDSLDSEKYPLNEVEVKDGKLTGIVKDHTHFLLWSKVIYTEEQQLEAIDKSNNLLLENGITSVHDAGQFGKLSHKLMQRVCKERRFKPREYMMIHSIFGKPFSLEENELFISLGFETGLGDSYFRIGSSKFMIDGGSSGPSCATREPYSHDPLMPYILGWQRDEVYAYLEYLNYNGCQATAHAVGDLAIEFMVEGYEKVFKENPRPNLRHRIEHTAIVDEDLVERMAKLNLFPSLNPGFISWNGRNYTKYFGERMEYFMALKTMIKYGVKASIASDAPSGPIGSMEILDACINRVDRVTGEVIMGDQKISLVEAIKMYTLNGAYASFEEDIKGSIEPGKLADVAVLSEDLTKYPLENIRDVKVDITIIDGIIEYKRLMSRLS